MYHTYYYYTKIQNYFFAHIENLHPARFIKFQIVFGEKMEPHIPHICSFVFIRLRLNVKRLGVSESQSFAKCIL